MITWTIDQMTRVAADWLVVTVDWRATDQDSGYVATTTGTVGLDRGDSFTPYEDLTQEQVVSWVKESVNVDEIESNLATEISLKKNPVVLPGKPW